MRRAVSSLLERISSARSAALVLAGLAWSGACSVYQAPVDSGGGGSGGGGAGTAGSAGTAGTVEPNNAGDAGSPAEPGDMSGGGTGGTESIAGSASGGSSGTAGAGGTAGGGVGGGATGGSGGTTSGGTTAGGTNAGGASAGGSGGSAGAPPSNPGLIDDFEDNNLLIHQPGGGTWYLFDDGTMPGSVGPKPLVCTLLTDAPAELGSRGMHVTATGFTGFGTGLGVDFRAGTLVYDASKFSGIRFWAKIGTGKNPSHRVQLSDATTDAAGMLCDATSTAANDKKCGNHFGVNETFTASWVQYSVRFDKMSQVKGWGNTAAALDKAHLYGLQVTATSQVEVDLWLDQIEFF